ncbi:MAG: TRAP transporter small permease [Thermodesulfobacteriota bacterium]
MGYMERILNSISRWLNWVACGVLVGMMVLECCDVIGRSFRRPIVGSYDLVCLLSVVLIAFSLSYTHVQRRHICVDLIVMHLSPLAKAITSCVTTALGIVFFGLLSWQSCVLARRLWVVGEVSSTLHIPLYPLIYLIALAAAIMCILLLLDLLKTLKELTSK